MKLHVIQKKIALALLLSFLAVPVPMQSGFSDNLPMLMGGLGTLTALYQQLEWKDHRVLKYVP